MPRITVTPSGTSTTSWKLHTNEAIGRSIAPRSGSQANALGHPISVAKPTGINIGKIAIIDIDAIHVVNLKHRTDRREEVEREIQKAVDAGIFPDIKPVFVNRLPKGGLIPLSFGSVSFYQTGCEHQRIMEQLFQEKRNLSLILEDDAEWTPSFFAGIADFWSDVQKHAPDWLALFLGGSDVNGRTPVEGSSLVALNNGSTQCHAYIVNRAGLLRLYDHLYVDKGIIDWAYVNMMRVDQCCYSPSSEWFANPRKSWSDNAKQIQ